MNCKHCGATLNPGSAVCSVCGTAVTGAPAPQPVAEKGGMGILGALIGAIIGGLSIILLGRLGYVAALSGVVIAFGTLKGYELLGKCLSKKGVIISIILMVLTPFLAYNIDLILQLHEEWTRLLPSMTMGDTISLLLEVLEMDSELMGTYLSELGMIYLFTALGAFGIILTALRNV